VLVLRSEGFCDGLVGLLCMSVRWREKHGGVLETLVWSCIYGFFGRRGLFVGFYEHPLGGECSGSCLAEHISSWSGRGEGFLVGDEGGGHGVRGFAESKSGSDYFFRGACSVLVRLVFAGLPVAKKLLAGFLRAPPFGGVHFMWVVREYCVPGSGPFRFFWGVSAVSGGSSVTGMGELGSGGLSF